MVQIEMTTDIAMLFDFYTQSWTLKSYLAPFWCSPHFFQTEGERDPTERPWHWFFEYKTWFGIVKSVNGTYDV